jgi:hypothetical protein
VRAPLARRLKPSSPMIARLLWIAVALCVLGAIPDVSASAPSGGRGPGALVARPQEAAAPAARAEAAVP